MKPSHLIRGRETWWRAFDRAPAIDDIARVFGARSRRKRGISTRWIYRKGRRVMVVTISRGCGGKGLTTSA
jgi:hypothetical protein